MRTSVLSIVVLCINIFPAMIVAAEPDFDRLLTQYRSYDLPEPPADAQPIVCELRGCVINGNRKVVHVSQTFGFLVANEGEENPDTVLFGTESLPLDRVGKVTHIDPNKVEIGNVAYSFAGMPSGLATAVQCKARGWDTFAHTLWKQSILKHDKTAGNSYKFYRPTLGDKPADVVMATIAFHHYRVCLYDDLDWKPAARKLLKIETPTAGLHDEYFVETVTAALKPSTAEPGTTEALIDDLIESKGPWDSQNKRITVLGIDAVPTLIEHVDDERWTRGYGMGLGLSTQYYQVGDYCKSILRGLAGEPEYSIREVRKSKLNDSDGYISKTKARKWYRRVRKLDEEQYLLDHALPKNDYPNETILLAIAEKYPQRIRRLYEEFLSKPLADDEESQAEFMAEVVANSRLRSAEKVALLTLAIEHRDITHRMAALSCLEKLDFQQYFAYLRKALKSLPKTASNDYWPFFVWGVAESNDVETRVILLAIAKEGGPELRMQLIHEVAIVHSRAKNLKDRDKWRNYAVNFAKTFLDDSRSCGSSLSEQLGGLWAEDSFPKMEVRNLAAIHLGRLLGVKEHPQKDWTPREWSAFRGLVSSMHQNQRHR